MIIERLKKLIEEKRIKKAEHVKYANHLGILRIISEYFIDHPTENSVVIGGYVYAVLKDNFDEDYAMNMDLGKPYIIKKKLDMYGEYLEITCREEYRPELYY